VRQITGISIRETLPTPRWMVRNSSWWTCRRRTACPTGCGQGVSPGIRSAAQDHFFRTGNLAALRELACVFAAEHVGHDVLAYRQAYRIADPWKSGQRLLVAVSSSPTSAALVRWTRRLAGELQAPWMAVYVELPRALGRRNKRAWLGICTGTRAGRRGHHDHG